MAKKGLKPSFPCDISGTYLTRSKRIDSQQVKTTCFGGYLLDCMIVIFKYFYS